MIKNTYGENTVKHIENMTKHKIRENIMLKSGVLIEICNYKWSFGSRS